MRVLSFGAGVQSTYILERSLRGDYPRMDAVIFADTGAEPEGVYRCCGRYEAKCKMAGVPFVRVSAGNIITDTTGDSIPRNGKGTGNFASMPLHLKTPVTRKNKSGSGMLRRQCTSEYKIAPIREKMRELGASRKNPAELWMGVSADEIQRIKQPDVLYVVNYYPLCRGYSTGKGWDGTFDTTMDAVRRSDCIQWFKSVGLDVPEKSACIFCPFKDNARWREHKQNPEEWQSIIRIDQVVRTLKRIKGVAFLHRSLKPIDEADLGEDDSLFGLGFDNECEGMCGV